MSSHNFALKCTVITDGGPPVERTYNKVMKSDKGGTTYRCAACGGRFTHDPSKTPSFEEWRDRKIAKCPQGAKPAKGKGKKKKKK
jgi:hypothetical protein